VDQEELVMTSTVKPSTIDGIKRLAKHIKREKGFTHLQALNVAATRAGFQNFRHAQNALSMGHHRDEFPAQNTILRATLTLSAIWRDASGRDWRETLQLRISAPIDELLSPTERRAGRLANFQKSGTDHLQWKATCTTQDDARATLCRAARDVAFTDVSGLTPATRRSETTKAFGLYGLPGKDHSRTWFNKATQSYVATDEPYTPAVWRHQQARTDWAIHNGFLIARANARGPHSADRHAPTELYFLVKQSQSAILETLINRMNNFTNPIVDSEWGDEHPNWIGESTSASEEKERPRHGKVARKREVASDNAVEYQMMLGNTSSRPDRKMPIEAHIEAGKLLKDVLEIAENRAGAERRIGMVRTQLDDWAACEYHKSELSNEIFLNMYYGGGTSSTVRLPTAAQRSECIDKLEQVKSLLSQYYPSCRPVDSLNRDIDFAIKSLSTWGSTRPR
jgi:hypothetical protein